jgi:hypothetical protein
VQVGGAHVDGVHQHLLQEAHDRRVLDLGHVRRRGARTRVFRDLEIEVGGADRLQRLVRGAGLSSMSLLSLSCSTTTHSGELGGELDALAGS